MFSEISIEQLRNSELRIQENNYDTIIALAQRSFGTAYQFVPPMSITLGMKECLSAKCKRRRRKIRFPHTGTKGTAGGECFFKECNNRSCGREEAYT